MATLKSPVDAAVRAYMQQDGVTGCSLALVMPDASGGALETTLLNYGTVSKASTAPVDVGTEYEIGSLTKLFTADLLALYVQDGLMHLDDPLQKYLPASVQYEPTAARSSPCCTWRRTRPAYRATSIADLLSAL